MGAEDYPLDTERFTSPFGIDLHAPTRGQTPSAAYSVRIGMDGRGRVFDNLFLERLWRTVNEDIYYGSVAELDAGLARYFRFYNESWPHESLGCRTPAAVHAVVKL